MQNVLASVNMHCNYIIVNVANEIHNLSSFIEMNFISNSKQVPDNKYGRL
jgi:hypothetical protein